MSTDTPAEAPQPAAEGAPEGVAPDMGAIMSRMDELSTQVQSLSQPTQRDDSPEWAGQGISDLPYQDYGQDNQYDQQQGYDPYAQQQYDPYQQQGQQYGQDPYGQQSPQQAQQALDQYVNQAISRGIEQAMAPYQQREQYNRAKALEEKYGLQDPPKAAALVKQADQYARRIGKPELARDVDFVELVHLAQMARDRASQETPADGEQQPVHLEGSGAAPQAEEMTDGDRMLQAWGVDPTNPYG